MARATTGVAYLVLGLTILGGLVFTAFVTLPVWSGYRAVRQELAAAIAARDERAAFLADIDARSAELKTRERDAQQLAVLFPVERAPAELAAIFQAAAARSGVSIRTFTAPKRRKATGETAVGAAPAAAAREALRETGTTAPPPAPSPAPSEPAHEFTLTARGTYAQLRAFVSDLERAPRFFDLPAVQVKGAGPEGGVVDGEFTLLTYPVES